MKNKKVNLDSRSVCHNAPLYKTGNKGVLEVTCLVCHQKADWHNPPAKTQKEKVTPMNNSMKNKESEEEKVELITMRCLECGQEIPIAANGVVIRYGLNVFCHDKNCEDIYAFKH